MRQKIFENYNLNPKIILAQSMKKIEEEEDEELITSIIDPGPVLVHNKEKSILCQHLAYRVKWTAKNLTCTSQPEHSYIFFSFPFCFSSET